ncbi:protein-cysteine N-palmitoyltransferase Rasp-like [Contarinia nasturtii]|uniref:protein-cysteine N-palmitoyltransferase Rasp-like n=1 Tax=Contarinia nasturtii TaxID=265458 RepID=UPI0012D3C93D|nr:protein-cysteine N-palmitoyltransferase Rasp-like [Contarinia nasturtii]
MFLVVFSYYVTMLVGKRYVWMLTMIWLVILNNLKHGAWKEGLRLFLSEREIYNVDISIAWLVLRVTSFSIDYCNAPEQIHDSFSTINYLAYAFYLPMYVHGPPLIYERYAKMIPKNRFRPIKELMCRLSELFLSLLRIGFIYCLNEICMHYIYATVIIYNPDQIAHMDCWTLYGFGYAMGQYFCNKYMVLYGFGLALAKFDRIDAQRKPMCIGRIHLYSKMWKNFDRGIYDFLFKHIYAELCTKTSSVPRKLVASCVSFAFIYLWHGFHTGFLLGWVLMNLTFLYIEQLGRHIAQSETYNRVLKPIGSNNIQRLNTALGAQLTIVTTILNITFIGGLSVGKWIVTHVYFTGGFLNYIIISITAYNVFQVSAFIFKCEKMTRN